MYHFRHSTILFAIPPIFLLLLRLAEELY